MAAYVLLDYNRKVTHDLKTLLGRIPDELGRRVHKLATPGVVELLPTNLVFARRVLFVDQSRYATRPGVRRNAPSTLDQGPNAGDR